VIIDTSALLAILLDEPESSALVAAISAAPVRLIAAPTLVEASAVLHGRKGPSGDVALDALLHRLSVITVDMNSTAAAFARDAFRRFGKGVGNPAVLNYGDCLVYGVALATGRPLLFKGTDFAQTDVVRAPY
jgi:ribonuclease VapC